MKHLDAPETALALGNQLTEIEAHMLEKDVARVGRKYGQATARVRRLRAGLKKAEAEVRELRRQMRLLISARKV